MRGLEKRILSAGDQPVRALCRIQVSPPFIRTARAPRANGALPCSFMSCSDRASESLKQRRRFGKVRRLCPRAASALSASTAASDGGYSLATITGSSTTTAGLRAASTDATRTVLSSSPTFRSSPHPPRCHQTTAGIASPPPFCAVQPARSFRTRCLIVLRSARPPLDQSPIRYVITTPSFIVDVKRG